MVSDVLMMDRTVHSVISFCPIQGIYVLMMSGIGHYRVSSTDDVVRVW